MFVYLKPHILLCVSWHIRVYLRPHVLVYLRPRILQEKSAPYASVHTLSGSPRNAYIIFHMEIFFLIHLFLPLRVRGLSNCLRACCVCVCVVCVYVCGVCGVCVCVRAWMCRTGVSLFLHGKRRPVDGDGRLYPTLLALLVQKYAS